MPRSASCMRQICEDESQPDIVAMLEAGKLRYDGVIEAEHTPRGPVAGSLPTLRPYIDT